MMQLAISQKAQDMELAKAFLKMKTDQSQGPGFESGDKVFKIEDPNFPGNFYNVKGLTGKDGRIYYRDSNNNVVPAQQGQVGYATKELPEKINLYSANLEENKRAQEMINSVIEVLPDSGTFTAAFGLAKEDAYGTVEQVFGKNNLGGADFDSEIKRLIRNNDDGTEQGKKDANSLMKKYDEDMD
jgi:molecular chaperone DnaK (HSP70)